MWKEERGSGRKEGREEGEEEWNVCLWELLSSFSPPPPPPHTAYQPGSPPSLLSRGVGQLQQDPAEETGPGAAHPVPGRETAPNPPSPRPPRPPSRTCPSLPRTHPLMTSHLITSHSSLTPPVSYYPIVVCFHGNRVECARSPRVITKQQLLCDECSIVLYCMCGTVPGGGLAATVEEWNWNDAPV